VVDWKRSDNFYKLFNVLERVPKYSWRGVFEGTRRLKGFLMRIQLVVAGSPTVESGLASVSFARTVLTMVRKSGLLFTALYLKQCRVALMRFYSGNAIKAESQPVMVSLTRSGCPRIIPKHLRHQIYLGGERGDHLVKLYLSWFSLCVIVELSKKLTSKTLSSSTEVYRNECDFQEVHGLIKDYIPSFRNRYLKQIATLPMDIGMRWIPTWKALPNRAPPQFEIKDKSPTIFNTLIVELAAYAENLLFVNNQNTKKTPTLQLKSSYFIPFHFIPFQ